MRGKKTFTKKIAVLAATLFMGVFINSGSACAKQKVSFAHETEKMFSPFVRVATVDAVFNDDGTVNEWASYNKGQAVGSAISAYITLNDEAVTLDFPSDWVVAGDTVLNVPSKQQVTKPDGTKTVKKIQVIEICNKAYAQKALGAAPITDSAIPNGFIHAPALPCEISVHFEGDKIHVYMLNAEAIFTLFFTDVVTSDLMLDPEFREQMQLLTAAVKSEMRDMIYAALGANTIAFSATDDMVGPVYRNIGDAVSTVAHTENQSPYVHFVYSKDKEKDDTPFSKEELAAIAATVTETLTYEGQNGITAGAHEEELENILSTYNGKSSSWRAARAIPLGMPDGSKVVEPCSPTYAKEAIGTSRLDHAPALPCEIAFRLINGGTELLVSYLDPNFMFGVMFSDMSDEEIAAFGDIPAVVLDDLQKIVNYSLENDLGIALDAGEQVYYDMLLGDGFVGVANKRR